MKKVIIFGATGLVGAYGALYLKKYGYDVIAVGRRESDNGFFGTHGIPYYSLDVADKDAFAKIPNTEIDTVIHLAGPMPATMKGYNPHVFVKSIVDGTLNVLEFARDNDVKKFLFAQSRADSNYLMGKEPIPSDIVKKFPLKGDHSVYSICKNAAVDLVEHFYWQYGIKRFVLRLPTIYGFHPNPYFYVNGERKYIGYRLIMEKAIKGEPIEIWGDPKKAKEIVYINDLLQIIRLCLESELDGGMYNVGRGVPVTLEEQILGIIDVFSPADHKSPVVYCPEKPDGREYVNDISKTQKDLGYQPEYDYHSLLVDFKRYMDENPFKQLWGEIKDYD